MQSLELAAVDVIAESTISDDLDSLVNALDGPLELAQGFFEMFHDRCCFSISGLVGRFVKHREGFGFKEKCIPGDRQHVAQFASFVAIVYFW